MSHEWTKIGTLNTYQDGQIIYASDFNEDNTEIKTKVNAFVDEVEEVIDDIDEAVDDLELEVGLREQKANKVSTMTGYSTETNKYPNTKAVYDYVNPINTRVGIIENKKVNTISGNEASTQNYPSTKAVFEWVRDKNAIFWCTYGTTTATEIANAITAGKVPVVLSSNKLFVLAYDHTERYYFGAAYSNSSSYVSLLKATNTWSSSTRTLEDSNNKKTTIEGNETSTTYYPTTGAVADAISAAENVFIVTSSTPANDAVTAYEAGKAVFLVAGYRVYPMSFYNDTNVYYGVTHAVAGGARVYYAMHNRSTNAFTAGSYQLPSTIVFTDSGDNVVCSETFATVRSKIVGGTPLTASYRDRMYQLSYNDANTIYFEYHFTEYVGDEVDMTIKTIVLNSDDTVDTNGSILTNSYLDLEDKPSIGGVTVSGAKTLDDFGIQEELVAGSGITISGNTISATGGGTTEIYWCEYGITTGTDITAAITAGKIPAVKYNTRIYVYAGSESDKHNFGSTFSGTNYWVYVGMTNATWNNSNQPLEYVSRKTTTIEGYEGSNTCYPTTKAVYDYAEKKKTWELIKEVTLESEVAYNDPLYIQTDTAGNAFQLTDMMVQVKAPPAEGNADSYITMHWINQSGTLYSMPTIASLPPSSSTAAHYNVIYRVSKSGGWVPTAGSRKGTVGTSASYQIYNEADIPYNTEYTKGIRIKGYQSTSPAIPAGTVIKIYGIRV